MHFCLGGYTRDLCCLPSTDRETDKETDREVKVEEELLIYSPILWSGKELGNRKQEKGVMIRKLKQKKKTKFPNQRKGERPDLENRKKK